MYFTCSIFSHHAKFLFCYKYFLFLTFKFIGVRKICESTSLIMICSEFSLGSRRGGCHLCGPRWHLQLSNSKCLGTLTRGQIIRSFLRLGVSSFSVPTKAMSQRKTSFYGRHVNKNATFARQNDGWNATATLDFCSLTFSVHGLCRQHLTVRRVHSDDGVCRINGENSEDLDCVWMSPVIILSTVWPFVAWND